MKVRTPPARIESWSGRAVTWTPWRESPAGMDCGPGTGLDACEVCASVRKPAYAVGIVHPNLGDTDRSMTREASRELGKDYMGGRTVTARAHSRLTVFRCQDCSADRVFDQDTATWWTFDKHDEERV